MKCEEYLEKILKDYEKHGDEYVYDAAVENMPYFCSDYDEYMENLSKIY